MNANERAQLGYDEQHRDDLVAAIMDAIKAASTIADPPVMMLRTGELTDALITVLALIMALSPPAVRSPAAIRKTTEVLRQRLQARVAAARASAEFQDLEKRFFRSDDDERGGHT
jgi:hypothetical protein